MKKEKSKIIFQRFGVFVLVFFVTIVAVFSFAAPVSAVTLSPTRLPFYFIDTSFSFDYEQLWEVSGSVTIGDVTYQLGGLSYVPEAYVDGGQTFGPGFVCLAYNNDEPYLFNLSDSDLILFDSFDLIPDELFPALVFAGYNSGLVIKSYTASSPYSDLVFPFTYNGEHFVSITNIFLMMFFVRADGSTYALTSADIGNIIYFDGYLYPSSSDELLTIQSRFDAYEPPSFIDRLTSGFTTAIGWLGDFFTSLFTGNLVLAFVLVSVGFGLALLSFGWRWIRRFLWGY